MKKLFVAALALRALLPWHTALANDLTWEAGLQAQHFWEEAQSEEQSSDNLSGSLQASYYRDWNDGLRQFVATPFYREDGSDPKRSQFDLREFYVLESLDQADVYLGLRKVFWGVTETLNLVNIINQSDAVEDASIEEKLGQPMLSATWFADNGDWDFFLLPYFRERTLPGAEGRFRPALVVDTDSAIYESEDEQNHLDWALRWSTVLGDFDLGLSYFSGTSRAPKLLLSTNAEGEPVLVPFYQLLDQAGLDLQYTTDSWIWKLEALSRYVGSQRSSAAVAGFEYTWYGIAESVIDIGFLSEYQYDDRTGDDEPIADDDLALGLRLLFNDVQDSQLLAIYRQDLGTPSSLSTLEAQRRIGDSMQINLSIGTFYSTEPADQFYSFRNDDLLQLDLIYYF